MVAGEIPRAVDVLVIGGGPGGYTAAARAAALGRSVVLVERAKLGGTCLHVGCIPSKALITLASDLQRARDRASGRGLLGELSVDAKAALDGRATVIQRLQAGVEHLLSDVEIVRGTGRFVDRRRVAVETEDGVVHLAFEHCIIASGSRPRDLGTLPVDGRRIIDSTGAVGLDTIPEKLTVVGGGYIGLELGGAFASLGSRVTVVEALPEVLAGFDADLVEVVRSSLTRLGVEILCSTEVVCDDGTNVIVRTPEGEREIESSHVLVAIGRTPNVDDLQLEDAGVDLAGTGLIDVDAQLRTTNPVIFAIGDVVPGPALAHKASMEGRVAAEASCGHPSAFDQVVPLIAFTTPELASVGLSESAARDAGLDVVVGRARLSANGRALTLDDSEGFVKLIAEVSSGVVLGVQIVGPHASELIAEGTVLVELAARLDDVDLIIHAHPTLGEVVSDAASMARRRLSRRLDATGR